MEKQYFFISTPSHNIQNQEKCFLFLTTYYVESAVIFMNSYIINGMKRNYCIYPPRFRPYETGISYKWLRGHFRSLDTALIQFVT